jgi:hypothetical protein
MTEARARQKRCAAVMSAGSAVVAPARLRGMTADRPGRRPRVTQAVLVGNPATAYVLDMDTRLI